MTARSSAKGAARARLLLVCLSLAACSRRAEIFDEVDSGISTGPGGPSRDKPYSGIDAGLNDSALGPCSERSEGSCRGPNDFPCDFERWVSGVVDSCRSATDCRPNGWLATEIGDDGCLIAVETTEPPSVFTDCVSQRLREVQCPCPRKRFELFLGSGNASCLDSTPKPCQSGEFVCGTNEVCVNGFCIRNGAGGAQ